MFYMTKLPQLIWVEVVGHGFSLVWGTFFVRYFHLFYFHDTAEFMESIWCIILKAPTPFWSSHSVTIPYIWFLIIICVNLGYTLFRLFRICFFPYKILIEMKSPETFVLRTLRRESRFILLPLTLSLSWGLPSLNYIPFPRFFHIISSG